MKANTKSMKWTREPKQYTITEDRVELITEPFTDLWQRTYYHFRNDNAPVLQMSTEEKYFSFVVRTTFDTKVRYDQSGIVVYLDSENWLKECRGIIITPRSIPNADQLNHHSPPVEDSSSFRFLHFFPL